MTDHRAPVDATFEPITFTDALRAGGPLREITDVFQGLFDAGHTVTDTHLARFSTAAEVLSVRGDCLASGRRIAFRYDCRSAPGGQPWSLTVAGRVQDLSEVSGSGRDEQRQQVVAQAHRRLAEFTAGLVHGLSCLQCGSDAIEFTVRGWSVCRACNKGQMQGEAMLCPHWCEECEQHALPPTPPSS